MAEQALGLGGFEVENRLRHAGTGERDSRQEHEHGPGGEQASGEQTHTSPLTQWTVWPKQHEGGPVRGTARRVRLASIIARRRLPGTGRGGPQAGFGAPRRKRDA